MGIIAANSAYTSAVRSAISPLIINPTKTAGPALLAATPVSVKTPDPMMLPNPSRTKVDKLLVGMNLSFRFLILIY